jgi:hypothetical protein
MKKTRLTLFAVSLILSSCAQGQQNNKTDNNTTAKTGIHRIAGTADGIQPEYPGGLPAANKYLNDHFAYPDKARKLSRDDGNPPTGKVWINFTIDQNGNIGSVETKPYVHYSITDEVESVLKQMPKWSPATLGGKPVPFHMSLRLTLDPNKSAPTITDEAQSSNDIKVSPEDKQEYEQEVTSQSSYSKVAAAEYQQQVAKEKKEGYADDAALIITRKQLGDRIVWREQFLKKYPVSPVSSKVNNEILSFMDVLIFSSTLDNDPTYEPSGQRLMVESVKKGFEELIRAYPESRYMQVLKKYYEMTKANGFRYSKDKDLDFRDKYQLPAMN